MTLEISSSEDSASEDPGLECAQATPERALFVCGFTIWPCRTAVQSAAHKSAVHEGRE